MNSVFNARFLEYFIIVILYGFDGNKQLICDFFVGLPLAELGYSIRATGTQGSDQIAFAQAGIVTSGVGTISQYRHTSKDVPENMNRQGLRIAGEIAACVVLKTANRFKAKNQ